MNKSKVIKVLSAIATLLVIILILGLIVRFTNIGGMLDPTFRVECNGNQYTDGDNYLILRDSESIRFDVKNGNGYTVKVLPNVTQETDFDYVADGYSYSFLSGSDYTGYFLDEKDIYGDYFIIRNPANCSLVKVLSRMHGGAEITVAGHGQYPFLLEVTSNGNIVRIALAIVCGEVDNLTFDKDIYYFEDL